MFFQHEVSALDRITALVRSWVIESVALRTPGDDLQHLHEINEESVVKIISVEKVKRETLPTTRIWISSTKTPRLEYLLLYNKYKVSLSIIYIQKPQSLSELTQYYISSELTHLGSEGSI